MVWWLFRDEPEETMKALDEAWQNAYHVTDFNPLTDRYIIMSDLHKGDRRKSDDFRSNEYIYCFALEYYLRHNFRLILNGDVEEGWECEYSDIAREYKDTAFLMERQFAEKGEGYYLRIFGNHDYHWRSQEATKKYLWPLLGEIEVTEAVRLGDYIFLVHGHQGQPFDDPLRFPYSHLAIRYLWAPIVQGLLGLGGPSASRNTKVRKKRDNLLYEWARKKGQILIAGHTHHAMFRSSSKAGQLKEILEELQQPRLTGARPNYELLAAIRELNSVIMVASDLLAEDRKRETPNYFNSGCCLYSDGITGIEIDRGAIRLVKWEITDAYFDPGDDHPELSVERHPTLGYSIVRRIYQHTPLASLIEQIQR